MRKPVFRSVKKIIYRSIITFFIFSILSCSCSFPLLTESAIAATVVNGTSPSSVIAIAEAEVGYLEKASNSQLYDKTANSGNKNWNKYAADIDKYYPNFYNGKKNIGGSCGWCDIFVDWCFIKAYGYDNALKLLCQPTKSCGAGPSWSMKYYKNAGQFGTKPKLGAQIFIKNASHTGLVINYDNKYVYTIEGNWGNAVKHVKRELGSSDITGYGYPGFDSDATTTYTEKEIDITGAVYPSGNYGSLTNFGLRGIVTTSGYLVSVEGSLYNLTTKDNDFYKKVSFSNTTTKSHDIQGEINNALIFGGLTGYYEYQIIATYVVNGETKTTILIDSFFTIGNYNLITSLSLQTTSITINVSNTYQLLASYEPSNASQTTFDWESSDSTVATISSNGLVTAVNPGTADIYCRTTDGTNLITTCHITVPETTILINSLSITRDGIPFSQNASIAMNIGDEIQLGTIVQPSNATNSNVKWSSSNIQTVSVSDNGYLVAWETGSATITCAATDGSNVHAILNVNVQCSHSNTTWITIREATSSQTGLRELHCLICGEVIQSEVLPKITVPVSLVFLTPDEYTIKAGTDVQLEADVYPSNASNRSVAWSSSDPTVAIVSSTGKVVAKSGGNAVISCTAMDGSDITATCSIHVWENESELSSVSESSFVMPASLTAIEDEAFAGIPVSNIRIPRDVRTIGSLAFGECPNLTQIFIPTSVTSIAGDAFEGSFFVSIVGYRNTYAESYASSQGIPFIALDPVATTVIVPESVSIGGDSTVSIGYTLELNGIVSPANATERTVKWKSSDTSIATVSDDGIVTAISPGTVTITATADGDTSLTASKAITVGQSYILAFDANEGSCNVINRSENSGCPLSEALPTATRDYYDFDGWYTALNGGTQVTQSSVFNSSDIVTVYAHWTIHPLSDWVLESQVPNNATIEETSWSYRESTESTSSAMSGWTANGDYWTQTGSGSTNYATFPSGFDTNHILYTSYAHEPYAASETTTEKREVVNTPYVGYIYWHWMYNVTWADVINRSIASAKGQYTYQSTNGETSDKANYYYFFAFSSTINCPSNGTTTAYNRPKGATVETWNCSNVIKSVTTEAQRNSNTSGVGCNRFYRFSYGTSTYTDYIKTFKYYRDINNASVDPGNGTNISNKVTYVKYREK